MTPDQALSRAERIVSDCNERLEAVHKGGGSDAVLRAVVSDAQQQLRTLCDILAAEHRTSSRHSRPQAVHGHDVAFVAAPWEDVTDARNVVRRALAHRQQRRQLRRRAGHLRHRLEDTIADMDQYKLALVTVQRRPEPLGREIIATAVELEYQR